jgi:hypothetical protein
LAHAASSDPFYRTTFAPPDTIAEWTITAGSWRFSNQEFINSSAGPLSIATVHTYEPSNLAPATIGRDFSLDFYALIVSCKTKKHREHPALGIELIIVRATPCPFQPKSCFISA